MTFDDLGLAQPILRAVHEEGYSIPTPIQAQAIPAVLAGGDLLAGAQTGTGKTAGFTLPLLHKLAAGEPVKNRNGRPAIRALILTPTRELAAQVEESVRTYGKYLQLTSMVIFGGVGMGPQVDRLRKGVDILVATPGRLLDHHQQGTIDLSQVQFFVLDEADRMLDMGFVHDIKKVLAIIPAKKQSLLFSATFSDEIKALADRLLNKPQVIEVARRNTTAETIAQRVIKVGRENKKDLLAHLIKSQNWHQVLVFTRMKHGANRLCEFLNKNDISAMAIHGNKSQGARTKALAEFKTGDLTVLVATDIAARGIDIDMLPHVINYELPNVPEDYVHRIGRTGRAGAQGEALSLVCVDEEGFLADIEKLIKRSIAREVVAGFEPDPGERAEPIQVGRRTLNGAPRGAHRPSGNGAPKPTHRGGNSSAPRSSAGHASGNGNHSAHARPAGQQPRSGQPNGAGRSSQGTAQPGALNRTPPRSRNG
ncbi:DEAD/DEAH box helicase domain protein [Leptothrix cholodnii SP-6]|uniref:ATP-dependent RNA helicase RhlE n=1 Tax=Leptothrix cholodnii (strain ATCC 51168 / LMG 8142 / SP-6) TaxID=395495 RepID=B1Y843_LEPCP|nr:DEAD/DEAH box helicase [Leptothrix cholodnii]ACB34913.1 DEAD/DEAH box helicase domain protein [Leptothrix cholodnii SP-6]